MKFDNTQVIIDLDIIAANFRSIREKVGVPVLAVVKADGYGHGAVQVARQLHNNCDFFGVSSMLEALELRNAGITTPILILGQIPPEQAGFDSSRQKQQQAGCQKDPPQDPPKPPACLFGFKTHSFFIRLR